MRERGSGSRCSSRGAPSRLSGAFRRQGGLLRHRGFFLRHDATWTMLMVEVGWHQRVICSPEHDTGIKAHFEVKASKTVKKVDHHEPREPCGKVAHPANLGDGSSGRTPGMECGEREIFHSTRFKDGPCAMDPLWLVLWMRCAVCSSCMNG